MPNSSNGRAGQGAAFDLVATLQRGMTAHQNGRLDEADALYRTVLNHDARQFDALQMLGILEAQRGRFEEGRKLIGRALAANPQSAEAHCNLGRVLRELGRHEQALESFDKALALNPLLIVALSNRGVVLQELGRGQEALESFARAQSLAPNNLDIMFNRGNALRRLRRFPEALAAYEAVLGYHAGYVDARIARANVLSDMQRFPEALQELDRVLVDQPKNAIALNNRANVLHSLGRPDDALESYNAAVAADPNYAQAYQNRGDLLMLRGLHRNAAADFAAALHLDAASKYALGNFVHCRMSACDWAGIDEARAALVEDVRAGRPAAVPFALLAVDASPADQLACARTFVADRYPSTAAAPPPGRPSHDRIRLAYVSADLREHAVSFLAAGLFEQHDRTRFETTAISLSPEVPSPMLDRLKAAFGRFVTVAGQTDDEVVALMRELEIDVAVDLMGHTRNARTGIFAARPAPIQVNWLGFGGTTGADYIDYIVADDFLIPEASRRHYSERPVYLPDTAQVNDTDRAPAASRPTREQAGLPPAALVFCAFNSSYKITPEMFRVWMRLLQTVEGSALWLLDSEGAPESLRREAAALGVAADRLIFAPRLPHADHLARCALADVFLDTYPCNGGATTSDLLWAGVPVVCRAGETFVSRVSGSLLRAVGMLELITRSLPDYEALAVALARDPGRLADTKAKLAANRATHPLFDTARFTRHLEAAYAGMWERHQRGIPPESFAVDPIA